MNQANFLGRITKDLDMKVSQSGKSVLNNTIAVNRPFKNAQGERDADFINFVAFGKTAEIISQYHKKGDMIGFSGRMQSRTYKDREDRTVFVTELVVNEMHFAGSNNGAQGQNNAGGQSPQSNQNNSYTQAYGSQTNGENAQAQQRREENPFADQNGPVDISDDDLPFDLGA